MATSTLWAISPLDEAAAIVEAEWVRLEHDQAPAEPDNAHPAADRPAPHAHPSASRDHHRRAAAVPLPGTSRHTTAGEAPTVGNPGVAHTAVSSGEPVSSNLLKDGG